MSVLIMCIVPRRLAIEHPAPPYVSTATGLCALEIETVNSICLQKTSLTTKRSEKKKASLLVGPNLLPWLYW